MTVAGILDIAGVLVAIGALGWLHTRPAGLSPVRDAVSHYGITPYALGYRVLTLAMAVSGLGAAFGILQLGHGRALVVVAALVVFAAARAAISWFPMDEPGGLVTPVGARHVILAGAAFVALFVAAVRLGSVLSRDGSWSSWRPWLIVAEIMLGLGLVAMVVVRRVPNLRAWFGGVERFYYAGALLWLTLVGVALT